MGRVECGPGMVGGTWGVRPAPQPTSPWWYDDSRGEVVRSKDGRRWRIEDVPPLALGRDGRGGDVDVEAVDCWVNEQSEAKSRD